MKIPRKIIGDASISHWVDAHCPTGCGCRVRSDGRIFWCSYIKCNWWCFRKEWVELIDLGKVTLIHSHKGVSHVD